MSWKYLWAILSAALLLFGCGNREQNNAYSGVIEGTTVEVPALTGGKILTMYLDTGDAVDAGARIAQVDTSDLALQKEQIAARLREVQINRRLAEINLERAKSNLDYVRQKYERFSKLYRQKSVPQQTVDDLANGLKTAESAYRAARRQRDTIGAKHNQLMAQLKLLQKKISDATVRAPMGGIVSAKYFEAGEAVPPGQPVVELIRLDRVWVKIYLSERQLPHIKIGQEVRIGVDGYRQKLAGKVAWISPRAEFTPKTIYTPETRTSLVYAVKITIDNPDQVLKQGMPVAVYLDTTGD